jgi:hypothetical protein
VPARGCRNRVLILSLRTARVVVYTVTLLLATGSTGVQAFLYVSRTCGNYSRAIPFSAGTGSQRSFDAGTGAF